MAMFRLQITSIARTANRSATGAAAYRAGEKIRDERSGELHNHSGRKDVTHKEILLPAQLAGQSMDWARDRASLWNAAERAERRGNARVAREIQVMLPAELPAAGRLEMARRFSQEVADHYGVAVDLALHDPRPSGDPRNFHAHLLLTTREVTPAGLGAKTGLDMNPRERVRLGLPNLSEEYTGLRARWATVTNEALRAANIEARVDHRSLAAQGIDRPPRAYIPFAEFRLEQAGEHSAVADSIRARYERSVRSRIDNVRREQAAEQPVSASSQTSNLSTSSGGARSLEDIRREARENWLKMRAVQSGPQPKASRDPEHGIDDDHLP